MVESIVSYKQKVDTCLIFYHCGKEHHTPCGSLDRMTIDNADIDVISATVEKPKLIGLENHPNINVHIYPGKRATKRENVLLVFNSTKI